MGGGEGDQGEQGSVSQSNNNIAPPAGEREGEAEVEDAGWAKDEGRRRAAAIFYRALRTLAAGRCLNRWKERIMRHTKRLVGMAAMSAVAGCLLLAQGTAGTGGRRLGMRGAAGQELLAGFLGLTDAQKAQAKTIFENAKTAAQPIRTQMKAARATLNAAITGGQPVDAPAAAVGTLFGQLTAIQANARVQFRAILTPAQLTKLDQFKAKMENGTATAPTP